MSSKPGSYGIEDLFERYYLSPDYWKSLARLRKDECVVSVEDGSLRFRRYPFEPAGVYPDGSIDPTQVSEVNLDSPPAIRLKSGEILFVSYEHKEALLTFVYRHDVHVAARRSVWTALLDPFLDTSEEQATIDRQFEWFASLGLNREAVDRWRREVGPAMIAYNFGTHLWEWVSFSLYDALIAQQARCTREQFRDFYARAMRLAALDPRSSSGGPAPASLASAVFSVLLEWVPQESSGGVDDLPARSRDRTERIKVLEERLVRELTQAYSEPSRRYHTVAHVEACLSELSRNWAYAVRLNEIRWALLFHDAIYDPRRTDNEVRSADWACRVMDELERPEEEQARVRRMIHATMHSGARAPATPDEALMLDIDLSILGASDATFDEYDRAIRAEYEWVPEESYRQARADVLRSFLNRDRIFQTAAYRALEPLARANLSRALERLTSR